MLYFVIHFLYDLSSERRAKKREKTVLRVSRITESLDRLLEKDAEDKRISVNALVNSIFTKYSQWDRYAEKFGFVSVGKDLFSSVLGAADEDKLAKIADDLGRQLPKQFILFWFKKLNIENFLAYISLISRYGGIAKCETQVDWRESTVTVLHELGPRWSIFMEHFIDQGLRTCLGITAEFDTTKNSLVARFMVS